MAVRQLMEVPGSLEICVKGRCLAERMMVSAIHCRHNETLVIEATHSLSVVVHWSSGLREVPFYAKKRALVRRWSPKVRSCSPDGELAPAASISRTCYPDVCQQGGRPTYIGQARHLGTPGRTRPDVAHVTFARSPKTVVNDQALVDTLATVQSLRTLPLPLRAESSN